MENISSPVRLAHYLRPISKTGQDPYKKMASEYLNAIRTFHNKQGIYRNKMKMLMAMLYPKVVLCFEKYNPTDPEDQQFFTHHVRISGVRDKKLEFEIFENDVHVLLHMFAKKA
jgi:hypothetical protein